MYLASFRNTFSRVAKLMRHQVKLVFVLEGDTKPLKHATLERRRLARVRRECKEEGSGDGACAGEGGSSSGCPQFREKITEVGKNNPETHWSSEFLSEEKGQKGSGFLYLINGILIVVDFV